jgi:hypothetical protein
MGAAWAVLDGRLYVMGGQGPGGALLSSGEVFDPATGWSPIAGLRGARDGAKAVVLNGRIYLMGGRDEDGAEDDVDVYLPSQNRWESFDHMEEERDGLAAGVVGGQLYALAGASESGSLLTSCEAYDGDDWYEYTAWSVSPARALPGSVDFGGGLVVAGGFSTFGPLATVQRFTAGQAPSSLPALPSARGGLALATDGAALFAVGGRDAADALLASVDRLGPGATGWTGLTPLPEPREDAVAAVLGADLYVVGGSEPFGSVLASAVRLPGAAVASDDGPASVVQTALRLDGPNPTRGPVRLRFEAPDARPVRLVVIDVRGREVAVLADGAVPTGPQTAVWDASGLPGGVYAARLTTSAGTTAVRFVVVR